MNSWNILKILWPAISNSSFIVIKKSVLNPITDNKHLNLKQKHYEKWSVNLFSQQREQTNQEERLWFTTSPLSYLLFYFFFLIFFCYSFTYKHFKSRKKTAKVAIVSIERTILRQGEINMHINIHSIQMSERTCLPRKKQWTFNDKRHIWVIEFAIIVQRVFILLF